MSYKLPAALALLVLSTTASAFDDVVVDLDPNQTDPTAYGRALPSGDPGTRSLTYNINTGTSYSVIITAQLYDNDIQGDYDNPGEIDISISGFYPDTSGFMPVQGDQYQSYQIKGIISGGPQQIVIRNNKGVNWTWGVKDVRVQLAYEITDPDPYFPFIPDPPVPEMPIAATIQVQNYCESRFSEHSTSSLVPELPISIMDYADEIMGATSDKPTQVNRERFIDYVHYVERVTGKSYLRESIGTNDFNLGMSFALLQIPGEQSEFGETDHVWCSASCPIGYTQTGIQCDTSIATLDSFTSLLTAEGFDQLNVCGVEPDKVPQYTTNDQISVETTLTCTRDVQTFNYRDVQGTPDWPIKN